jgi:hypothetical protein
MLSTLLDIDGFYSRRGRLLQLEDGDAQMVGFIDPWLKIGGEVPAYFGFTKFSKEASVNGRIFTQIEEWARAEGAKEIWGPIDYSTFANYRYRLNHLDKPEFLGEPGNGVRELGVMHDNGFRVGQRYVTYEIENLEAVRLWAEKQKLIESLRSLEGFQIVPARDLNLEGRVDEIYEVTLHIFSDNFAFKPVQLNYFKLLFSKITATMCQATSVFLLDAEQKIKGYFINFPDERDPARVLLKTAGVAPSARLMGLTFLALLSHVVTTRGHYSKASLCLMREGNFPSLISKNLFDSQTEYALFTKSL